MTQEIENRLIAFTGPDGIGKTTQATMLTLWLKELNSPWVVEYIKELNESSYIYKSFKNLVYSLYKEVDTVSLANLIMLNRYVLQEDIYSNHCKYDYNTTIVDRWNICTYCYLKAEGYYEELCLSYLTDEHTIIPGLTIMLVGMNGVSRTANREDNNNMFEDTDNCFKTKLAQTYIDFDESLYAGKIVKINNDDLSKEETQVVIREAVLEYLNGLS